jgi:MFS family permease
MCQTLRQIDSERFGVRPWIVWTTGLFAYIVAVLDRTTLGVSGLDAADRFNASPTALSTFVVLQVIVYAGAQVPAGLLLDRFGSKALIVLGDGRGPTRAGIHGVPTFGHRRTCGARPG